MTKNKKNELYNSEIKRTEFAAHSPTSSSVEMWNAWRCPPQFLCAVKAWSSITKATLPYIYFILFQKLIPLKKTHSGGAHGRRTKDTCS
jgi:hypothetical protein